ncbi:matrix metalloproteinase-28-like [Megalops cyprinoides]|uniref:matrix metalloproteinase-28-like n=1 Tax=Megalops cyprinoides TaxID=118141 RepID=UPI001864ED70|nr:matrix metalloproteinase-28-like [Megalops cyprinoides]
MEILMHLCHGSVCGHEPVSDGGFLEKYGYLHQEDHRHNSAEVTSAVRKFQWLSHLPITGRLDSSTLQQMAAPRCGVKDGRSHNTWAQRVRAIVTGDLAAGSHHRRSKRYSQPGEKWSKRHLTYRIMNWPRHLSQGSVKLAVRAAFQLWSNVSALVFQEVTQGPTDIRLAFFDGEHNDGTGNAFDGPGGALAHAFFPRRGEAHFDIAERWTLNGHKGHNLFMVTAHEIGHTLGLEHSPVRHALMSPYYKKLGKALVLSWDDITAVQMLYGKPASGQLVQLPGQVFSSALRDWEMTEGVKQNPTGQPQYCQGFFDAITMDQNNTVLVIRGGLFWTVSKGGNVSAPRPLQYRWPHLPLAVDAAAFSPVDSKFYFFKGRQVWRYSGSSLDPSFPKKSSEMGLPRHPDCAFFYAPLGHMVLLKGSRYFVLNLGALQLEPYYPRGLADWKGVPRGTNGALRWSDGRFYFFRQQHFWRFDPRKVRVTRGGKWAQELEWTGCRRTHGSNDIL